jgi:hypothetical protein
LNNIAICTISSANYFPFAKTMLQSVRAIHDDCDLYYLLVDHPHDDISAHLDFQTIDLRELQIPEQLHMTFIYDIVEMNTAVKPFLLSYLLAKGYSKVIYIDPDIYVYNRLDLAIKALDMHSLVLTPHALRPAPPVTSYAGKVQWEQNMTLTGIFNLGFIGISNCNNTIEFLAWWKNRCTFLCYMEPIVGLFVDQKWAELAIAYWDDVLVLRDPGYNVSVWNLHDRSISNKMVNRTHTLVFFHFSSIDINNESFLTKHDISITFQQYPSLSNLYSDYRAVIRQNGYEQYCMLPYAYSFFKDGGTIDLLERRLYIHATDNTWNPFACTRNEFYANLKKHLIAVNTRNTGLLLSFGSILAYYLLRIVGARRYRRLMMVGTKMIQFRAHRFLVP